MYAEYEEVFTRVGHGKFEPLLFTDLMRRYDEGERVYHNADHIKKGLGYIDRVLRYADELRGEHVDILKLAWFYHDAVYVPGLGANELLSAEMCLAHMRSQGAMLWHPLIKNLILSTKTHDPIGPLEKVICAVDLWELGVDTYWDNRVKVYEEFGCPPRDLWIEGRTKFLHTYLGKDRLYQIDSEDTTSREKNARKNMERELEIIEHCPLNANGDADCGSKYCPFCGS